MAKILGRSAVRRRHDTSTTRSAHFISSKQGFRYNAHVALPALAVAAVLAAFGGSLLLAPAAALSILIYIADVTRQRELTLVLVWVAVAIVLFMLFIIGAARLLLKSVWNIWAVVALGYAAALVIGVWGTLQMRWVQRESPRLALRFERLLLATLPIASAGLVAWGVAVTRGAAEVPLAFALALALASVLLIWGRDAAAAATAASGVGGGGARGATTHPPHSSFLLPPPRSSSGADAAKARTWTKDDVRLLAIRPVDAAVNAAALVIVPPLLYAALHRPTLAAMRADAWGGLLLAAGAPLLLIALAARAGRRPLWWVALPSPAAAEDAAPPPPPLRAAAVDASSLDHRALCCGCCAACSRAGALGAALLRSLREQSASRHRFEAALARWISVLGGVLALPALERTVVGPALRPLSYAAPAPPLAALGLDAAALRTLCIFAVVLPALHAAIGRGLPAALRALQETVVQSYGGGMLIKVGVAQRFAKLHRAAAACALSRAWRAAIDALCWASSASAAAASIGFPLWLLLPLPALSGASAAVIHALRDGDDEAAQDSTAVGIDPCLKRWRPARAKVVAVCALGTSATALWLALALFERWDLALAAAALAGTAVALPSVMRRGRGSGVASVALLLGFTLGACALDLVGVSVASATFGAGESALLSVLGVAVVARMRAQGTLPTTPTTLAFCIHAAKIAALASTAAAAGATLSSVLATMAWTLLLLVCCVAPLELQRPSLVAIATRLAGALAASVHLARSLLPLVAAFVLGPSESKTRRVQLSCDAFPAIAVGVLMHALAPRAADAQATATRAVMRLVAMGAVVTSLLYVAIDPTLDVLLAWRCFGLSLGWVPSALVPVAEAAHAHLAPSARYAIALRTLHPMLATLHGGRGAESESILSGGRWLVEVWGGWALIMTCVAAVAALGVVGAAERLQLHAIIINGDARAAMRRVGRSAPAAAPTRTLALWAALNLGIVVGAPLCVWVVASVLPALSSPRGAMPALQLCWLCCVAGSVLTCAFVAAVFFHGVQGVGAALLLPRFYGAILLCSGALLVAASVADAQNRTAAGKRVGAITPDDSAAVRALVAFLHVCIALALSPHRRSLRRVVDARTSRVGGAVVGMQQRWALVIATEAATVAYVGALSLTVPLLHTSASIAWCALVLSPALLLHQLPTRSPFAFSSAVLTTALAVISILHLPLALATSGLTLALDVAYLLCALPANLALVVELWGLRDVALSTTLMRCCCTSAKQGGGHGSTVYVRRRRRCAWWTIVAVHSGWTNLLHGSLAMVALLLSSVRAVQILGMLGVVGAGIGALLRQAHTERGEKVV